MHARTYAHALVSGLLLQLMQQGQQLLRFSALPRSLKTKVIHEYLNPNPKS